MKRIGHSLLVLALLLSVNALQAQTSKTTLFPYSKKYLYPRTVDAVPLGIVDGRSYYAASRMKHIIWYIMFVPVMPRLESYVFSVDVNGEDWEKKKLTGLAAPKYGKDPYLKFIPIGNGEGIQVSSARKKGSTRISLAKFNHVYEVLSRPKEYFSIPAKQNGKFSFNADTSAIVIYSMAPPKTTGRASKATQFVAFNYVALDREFNKLKSGAFKTKDSDKEYALTHVYSDKAGNMAAVLLRNNAENSSKAKKTSKNKSVETNVKAPPAVKLYYSAKGSKEFIPVEISNESLNLLTLDISGADESHLVLSGFCKLKSNNTVAWYSVPVRTDSLLPGQWVINPINKKFQTQLMENLSILQTKAYNKGLVTTNVVAKNDSTKIICYQPHAFSSAIGLDINTQINSGGSSATNIIPTKNFSFVWGDGLIAEVKHDTDIVSVFTVPASAQVFAKMPALNINSGSFERLIRVYESSPPRFKPVKMPNGDVHVVSVYYGNRRSNRLDITAFENGKLKTRTLFTSASPNKGWRCDPGSAFITEEGSLMCVARKGFRKVTMLKVDEADGKRKKKKS
ncbi:MAG: hypothetical protein JNK73_02595 [Bacteroidia bacterium]|nr:hypothetical protein [Bacteroidia bacterium]